MQHYPSRQGFTLVELLVVMALMAALAAMLVVYFPGASTSQREARAAQLVQGWLNIAKQRALRDQAPRGLRLNITQLIITGTTVSNVVTDCQYIEQPDDFSIGTIQSGPPFPAAPSFNDRNTIKFNLPVGVDLLNGNLPADTQFWAVQPGDYLEIFGTGLMYRIAAVGVLDSTGITHYDHIAIAPDMPFPITTVTSNYRILRAPRAVGSDALQLPAGTVIDLNTNVAFGNPPPPGAGYVDILFAPSGAVISRGTSTSIINLWVRNPSEDASQTANVFSGRPTIVSIFTRTGFVGAYAPGTSANPYVNVN